MQAHADPFRLDHRIALVTGGASGIGETTVKELAHAGAEVWIADINFPAAEALAAPTKARRQVRRRVDGGLEIGQRFLIAFGGDFLLSAKNVGIGPVLGHVEVDALDGRERAAGHHGDGLVQLAGGHLESDGAVLGIVALRDHVLVLLEERETLFDGRSRLLVELIDLGEVQGVLAVLGNGLLQLRDGLIGIGGGLQVRKPATAA